MAAGCLPLLIWPNGWPWPPRTIYRDVADLQHQGVPIEGEAVYAPLNVVTGLDAATRQRLQALREAVRAQRKVKNHLP